MHKSSVYSLVIVLIVPLLGYVLLYASTYQSIQMPSKYFVDTIITKTEKGKTMYDSIFHKIKKDIPVIDVTNKTSFNLSTIACNQVTLWYVANTADSFTETHLHQLLHLKKLIKVDSFIRLLCFINTPFPNRFLNMGISFLEIKNKALQQSFFAKEFKINIHSSMPAFVILVDKYNVVRNYYVLPHIDEEKLLSDIILLNLEKEPYKNGKAY